MTKIILPTYTSKQPSTGKTITFRPFTVKEEKALLLALQEEKIDAVSAAIKSVVSICTDGAIDVTKTPYYDIEYLFLQIRAKSVGEVIDLIGSCDCKVDAKTEFSIDIETTKIEPAPTGHVNIPIPDTNYILTMSHPSIDDFVLTFTTDGEKADEIVANCIVSVCTDDEVMNWNFDQKLEFVQSMTSRQQKDVAQFLRNMPMVKMDANYTCKHCGKKHEQVLSGFSNFFV